MLKRLLYISTISLIAAKILISVVIYFYPITDTADRSISAKELIEITNQYRTGQGLTPLTPNARLTQAAIDKAQDIITRQYFSHTSPDGRRFSYWIQKVNYDYFYAGENLALNFYDNKILFDSWLASPKHRDNIASPYYHDIGIAVISGQMHDRPTTVVVQMFGATVLGASETQESANAMYDFSSAPTPNQNWWHAVPPIATLDQLNKIITYLLIGILAVFMISHRPERPLADPEPNQNN